MDRIAHLVAIGVLAFLTYIAGNAALGNFTGLDKGGDLEGVLSFIFFIVMARALVAALFESHKVFSDKGEPFVAELVRALLLAFLKSLQFLIGLLPLGLLVSAILLMLNMSLPAAVELMAIIPLVALTVLIATSKRFWSIFGSLDAIAERLRSPVKQSKELTNKDAGSSFD